MEEVGNILWQNEISIFSVKQNTPHVNVNQYSHSIGFQTHAKHASKLIQLFYN
jgi:hypothetical protein